MSKGESRQEGASSRCTRLLRMRRSARKKLIFIAVGACHRRHRARRRFFALRGGKSSSTAHRNATSSRHCEPGPRSVGHLERLASQGPDERGRRFHSRICPRFALHIHPQLSIFIHGPERFPVPANVGHRAVPGQTMAAPFNTPRPTAGHDPRLNRRSWRSYNLGEFFDVWGRAP